MNILAAILTGFVALEHLYILWLEMFAWETAGRKAFKGSLPDEMFTPTKTLAANQGLYNGFLAAGLCWSFFIDDFLWKHNVLSSPVYMEALPPVKRYSLSRQSLQSSRFLQCYTVSINNPVPSSDSRPPIPDSPLTYPPGIFPPP